MRAAYLTGVETLSIRDTDLADPQPDEVAVRVEACGICGSNLHGWKHPELAITKEAEPQPGAAGHEVAGIVEYGPGQGRRVVIEPNLTGACGVCPGCLAGTAWFCRQRRQPPAWGFADRIVVPAAAVFLVPESVHPATATLVEPLACGVHAFRWSATALDGKLAGATVAVLGSGVAGLLAQVAARHLGAGRVLAMARHPQQAQAADHLGADLVVDASDEGVEALRAEKPAVVVEAVGGAASTFGHAMRMVDTGGEVVVLGLFDQPSTIDTRRAIFRENRLFFPVTYGRREGIHDFDLALQIMAERHRDLDRLITHRFPLGEVGAAFARAADKSGGALRVVVEP